MSTAKIIFSLSGEIADKLREDYEARKAQIQNFCSDDNPEAAKAVARIDNFLAKLETGAEFKLDEIQDEDDAEYFMEELSCLIDCILEV